MRGRVVSISDAADDRITTEGSDAGGGRLSSSKSTVRLVLAAPPSLSGRVTWTVKYSDGSGRKYTSWQKLTSAHFSSRSPGGTTVGGGSVHLHQVFRDVAEDHATAAEMDSQSSVKKARPAQKVKSKKKRRFVDYMCFECACKEEKNMESIGACRARVTVFILWLLNVCYY